MRDIFLSATQNKYDVIIGDVFHPDLVGLSSLLSVQQFQRARNRLSENGLFVQWLAINQFDSESLGVILRSFRRVFPDAQLFLDGMHLALVGPRQKFAGATGMLRNLAAHVRSTAGCGDGGEGGWTWLGRATGGRFLTRKGRCRMSGRRCSNSVCRARATLGSGCVCVVARLAA